MSESPSILIRILRLPIALFSLPFRYWRIWRFAFVLLILLIVAHTVADQILLRKLANQRAAIRAAGGAVSFTDLDMPKLSSGENAAASYEHADALLARLGAGIDEKLLDRFRAECEVSCGISRNRRREPAPLTDSDRVELAQLVEKTAPALDIVREARGLKGCLFGDYSNPEAIVSAPQSILPELDFMRSLARNTSYRALWEAQQGNMPEALDWVYTGLHLSNDIASDPILIFGLVRSAAAGATLLALQDMLYDKPLPEPVPQGLLDELEKLRDRKLIVRTFEGERCYANATYESMRRESGRFGRPIVTTPNELITNRLGIQLAEAVLEEDFAKRQALLEPIREFGRGFKKNGIMAPWSALARITVPALASAAASFDRLIAQVDVCEMALALKRYKARNGAYPEALEAIAPTFGRAMPMDPFDGQPYRYRRQEEGFIVYSVGQNGTDDGGEPRKGRDHGDICWCAAS